MLRLVTLCIKSAYPIFFKAKNYIMYAARKEFKCTTLK